MKLKLDVAERVVSRDGILNGAWLHLRSPRHNGDLLYADPEDMKYPARIKIRSQRHPDYQEFQYQKQAAASATRKERSRPTEKIVRDLMENDRPVNFSELVLELENLDSSQKGKVIVPDKADLIEVAKQPENFWIVEQVIGFAWDDTNFGLPAEDKPAGNAVAAEA